MKNILLAAFTLFAIPVFAGGGDRASEIEATKQKILALAESYRGQADPDFSRQKSFTPLLERLLSLAPQPPVSQRLDLIAGAWEQVWGPYDYRNDDRGIDPELGVNEIYQVVSRDGYYYNVSPLYKNGDRTKERIGLLRGEYKLDSRGPDLLRVRFTEYPGLPRRPRGLDLWELPALAESDRLEDRITIVPKWIVRTFFTGGVLREVYTDGDLRILFGSNEKNFSREALYVMKRKPLR